MNEINSSTRYIVNAQILSSGYFDDSFGVECFLNPRRNPNLLAQVNPQEVAPTGLRDVTRLNSGSINCYRKSYISLIDSAATSIKAYAPKENTLSQFVEMVKIWKKALQAHHFTGLISRLEFIFEDEPEFGLKQKPLSAESFSALLAYIATKPEFKTPSISYNRDGSFSASWQNDKKIRLTLAFIGLTRIRWVFVDSREGLEQAISGAGTVTNNMLQGILESYGGLEWMRR